MAEYKIKYVREKLSDNPPVQVKTPQDALAYLTEKCFDKDELWREKIFAVYMDNQKNICGHLLIGVGGVNEVTVDKHLVFKGAFDTMASAIILAHNHPSGNCMPSQHDIKETDQIRKACSILGFSLLDHIILGEGKYFSFVNEKMNEFPKKTSHHKA